MSSTNLSKQSKTSTLRRLRFLAHVKDAKEVVLTGDFTNWVKDKIKLNSIGDGEWETVLKLPAGEYQYRLLIDGEWKDHSEATKRVPNPFGTENCVLTVPES